MYARSLKSPALPVALRISICDSATCAHNDSALITYNPLQARVRKQINTHTHTHTQLLTTTHNYSRHRIWGLVKVKASLRARAQPLSGDDRHARDGRDSHGTLGGLLGAFARGGTDRNEVRRMR